MFLICVKRPLESVDHDSSVNGGAVSSPPPLPSIPPPPESALLSHESNTNAHVMDTLARNPGVQQNKEKLLSFVSDADSKSRAVMLENPAARNSRKMKHNDCKIGRVKLQCFAMSLGSFAIVPPALCSARPASIHQHLPHPHQALLLFRGLFPGNLDSLAAPGEPRGVAEQAIASSATASAHEQQAIQMSPPLPPPSPPGESPSFHRTLSADKLEALFNHVDKNHDGVLNVREMILGLRREPELAKLLDLPGVCAHYDCPPPPPYPIHHIRIQPNFKA